MLLLVDEAEDDLILAPYLYLDVLVDFQGDGLDGGCMDVEVQIPPVPGLLVLVSGEVVSQVWAQVQPRPRRHQAATALGPGGEGTASPRGASLPLLPPLPPVLFPPNVGPWQVGEMPTRR